MYIAAALKAGLSVADLYDLSYGMVLDIIAVSIGDYAELIDSDEADDSDFFGGI